jgi:hypothetical protein
MTLIMHMALWLATTLGVPIPDSALPDGACGDTVATSGTASPTACSTQNRNMRKAWRIYNGF